MFLTVRIQLTLKQLLEDFNYQHTLIKLRNLYNFFPKTPSKQKFFVPDSFVIFFIHDHRKSRVYRRTICIVISDYIFSIKFMHQCFKQIGLYRNLWFILAHEAYADQLLIFFENIHSYEFTTNIHSTHNHIHIETQW